MLAVTLYNSILALHILAVVVTFGATFAYGIMFGVVARNPAFSSTFYTMLSAVSRRLIQPGLVVILLAGIYLASKGHSWDEFWVQWALGAVVVLGALEGAVIGPALRRGVAVAGAEGGAEPGPEHQAIVRRVATFGGLADLIVVVTIFVMTAKPFS